MLCGVKRRVRRAAGRSRRPVTLAGCCGQLGQGLGRREGAGAIAHLQHFYGIARANASVF